jgi:hypothetical protein
MAQFPDSHRDLLDAPGTVRYVITIEPDTVNTFG